MIAVTTVGPDLGAEMDPHFGRAAYILLVDPATLRCKPLENPGRHARGGAGIQLAQLLSDRNVKAVISGRFGPKATEALKRAGIRMVTCGPSGTAEEAVSRWKEGKLG